MNIKKEVTKFDVYYIGLMIIISNLSKRPDDMMQIWSWGFVILTMLSVMVSFLFDKEDK